jgi:hypothetical protein
LVLKIPSGNPGTNAGNWLPKGLRIKGAKIQSISSVPLAMTGTNQIENEQKENLQKMCPRPIFCINLNAIFCH